MAFKSVNPSGYLSLSGSNVPSESYLSVFTCDAIKFLNAFQIKGLAEQESKSINLNIVCLRFDAFLVKNGIRNPICPPIFSHGINNLSKYSIVF